MNAIRTFVLVSLVGVLGVLVSGCGPGESTESAGDGSVAEESGTRPVIYVVNYPLYYFAKRIAGDQAEVVLPESSGSDPAFWKPGDDVLAAYQNADLILLWGADFAKWVKNVSLPLSRVVDTSTGITSQLIYEEEAVSHSHGDEGKHSHGAIAFNTWLDFQLMETQCRTITETLGARFPSGADEFTAAYELLKQDLQDLDQQFQAAVPEGFSETVFSSHPVYQYLGRRYGLSLINFHWEPGEMPDAEEWELFDQRVKETGARFMLWEGPPTDEIRARLESIGVTPIVILTGSGFPAEGDFLTVMSENARALASALGQTAP